MVINGGMNTTLLTATSDRPTTSLHVVTDGLHVVTERTTTQKRALVRDVDGLEVPASGIWPLLSASTIHRFAGRVTETLPIHQGWLELADDPTGCWMRIDTDEVLLELTSARVSPHAFEASAWQFDGTAEGAGARQPLTLELVYHGVYRRAGRTWAWFTGSGRIGDATPTRRFRRADVHELELDLLFAAR